MPSNRRNMTSAEIKAEVIDKIQKFSEPNKRTAKKLHDVILEADPTLHPRVWYGMPGYAKSKDGAVLLFFREDEGYMTLGFTEKVRITPKEDAKDKLMPCAWFFNELDDKTEQSIRSIVKDATAN